ncbi:GPW/gp25 family protein [Occallatibacter riparius]|uniref:GPW/gp25 family protein n=1 Tax=Occallatibacter riparius TaxID=1002689 RepID=A0A9J7BG61_9BACT|nr:GPW/gp25 family protein [Occallatibacter riparius]UWZ81743.1 GPW/gp25 family protein [Occallatibacter riparius]
MTIRRDIRYPFAIDAASGQAAQTDYASHVDQMIRQILLTDPGERVCLPTFGAGLRRLLFAPMNSSLGATTKLLVTQALNLWLANQITVKDVTVRTANSTTGGPVSGPPLPDGAIAIQVTYVLIETQSVTQTEVQVI